VAAHRWSTGELLRAATVSALFASALVWADRGPAATLFGLTLLGFSLAPIFPLLIAETPARLGEEHAAHAIGFQIAAACLGAAAVPAAAGLLARAHGVSVIPAVLVADAVALAVILEAAGRPGSGPAAPPRP
jgi:fucose permease